MTLRSVRLDADSISGVPWRQPLACEACRRSFPLHSVDSMRTGTTDTGALTAVAGVSIFVALIAAGLSQMFAGD